MTNKLKLACQGLKEQLQGKSGKEAVEIIRELVLKSCHRTYFKQMKFTKTVREYIDGISANSSKNRWDYFIATDGFPGLKYVARINLRGKSAVFC